MLSYRGYYAGARYGAFSLGAEHSMTPIGKQGRSGTYKNTQPAAYNSGKLSSWLCHNHCRTGFTGPRSDRSKH